MKKEAVIIQMLQPGHRIDAIFYDGEKDGLFRYPIFSWALMDDGSIRPYIFDGSGDIISLYDWEIIPKMGGREIYWSGALTDSKGERLLDPALLEDGRRSFLESFGEDPDEEDLKAFPFHRAWIVPNREKKAGSSDK